MQVKICGIRTLQEALAGIDAGADMLGFNFYPKSPRFLALDTCRGIVAALRKQQVSIPLVGVFVNADAVQIQGTLDYCNLDLAQLAGDESPEVLQQLGERAFKALRPADTDDLESTLKRYPARSTAPAWLVDAHRAGKYGGTGQTADWSLAARLAKKAPLLLAGGLSPQNVAMAIRQVNPWGVDVASGVESSPGVKDYEKMSLFIKEVRRFD